MRGNDRESGKTPLTAFDFKLFRHGDGEQMADGGRDDVIFALEKFAALVLRKAAERFGDVAGDRRFFCDDESFAHLLRGKLAEKISIVNSASD